VVTGIDRVRRRLWVTLAGAGLPANNVSPVQGRLLHLLVRAIGARNILGIGALGGYSTISAFPSM